jgi:MFS family permease
MEYEVFVTHYLNRFLNLNKRVSPMLIMSLIALFIVYRCVIQTAPSVMTQMLMQELKINATSMGHVSAAFWYAFVITQVCVGYWFDRYNPKGLIIMALVLCSVGTISFAYAKTFYSAIVARVLMGSGSAFAGGGYFKFASLWVKPKHFSLVTGLLATSVMMGVILGQAPVLWLMTYTHWREVFLLFAGIGIVLALSIALLCPWQLQQTAISSASTRAIQWRDVLGILKNPQNSLLALYHGLASAPLHAFSGVWGIDFLKQSCHINQATAALLSSFVFIGFGLGSPFMGYLADKTNKKRRLMWIGGSIAFLTLSAVLYIPTLSLLLKGILLFVFGFSSGITMISITLGKNLNPPKVMATVGTLLSSGSLMVPAITEPLIGYCLDHLKTNVGAKAHYFTLLDYQKVLSILLLYLVSTWIILWFVRERNPRSTPLDS